VTAGEPELANEPLLDAADSKEEEGQAAGLLDADAGGVGHAVDRADALFFGQDSPPSWALTWGGSVVPWPRTPADEDCDPAKWVCGLHWPSWRRVTSAPPPPEPEPPPRKARRDRQGLFAPGWDHGKRGAYGGP
jgi:hypothetical protein